MVGQTAVPKKFTTAVRTQYRGRDFPLLVGAAGLLTGITFQTSAAVLRQGVFAERLLAAKTISSLTKESAQLGATVVVGSTFDQHQLFSFRLGWAFKDDLTRMVSGQHHNLVLAQERLKLGDFFKSAGPQYYTSVTMKGLGTRGLYGMTVF